MTKRSVSSPDVGYGQSTDTVRYEYDCLWQSGGIKAKPDLVNGRM